MTMPAHNKRYWVIEITNRKLEPVFRKRLAGKLSTQKITAILQRLACCNLDPSEVIATSITSSLDEQVHTPPNGRTTIWLPMFRDYRAGYCRGEDELANCPEIPPED
jgi:hypothetical protein